MTIYTCPMHPEVQQDTPGRCPTCGMKLVPKETVQQKPMQTHHEDKALGKLTKRRYMPLIVIKG